MPIAIPPHQPGSAPTKDGEIRLYTPPGVKTSAHFSANRRVIFINGMANTGADHVASALGLAELQMCPVIGVYNATEGGLLDLRQCVADKYQFHGVGADSAAEALERAVAKAKQQGRPAATKESVMAEVLARNPASRAMFELLCEPAHRATEIMAHSQGNIILCNALHALVAADREDAVRGRVVNTFGSPVVPGNWPQSVRLREFGFTWDPVTWLGGPDWKLKISKAGMPAGSSLFSDGFGPWLSGKVPVTHGFLEYLKQDPTFVVNRFRWGSLGVTFSMDERAVGEALVEMGRNFPRVRRVLEHLQRHHPSDSDDIALEYCLALRDPRRSPNGLGEMVKRDAPLKNLLIALMESGWTGSNERDAIAWLKSP
ncbi:MAG: hypothetical protein ACF8QF_00805 [Phycisphaerales bacterium]